MLVHIRRHHVPAPRLRSAGRDWKDSPADVAPRAQARLATPDIGWDLQIADPPIYKATRPRLNPSVQPPDTRRWPRVQPVSAKFPIDLRAEKVVVDLPIFTSDRAVLYHFACRGVNESYLDTLPDNWVGPLTCTLAEGDQPSEDSLLSEDDSAAWFSRRSRAMPWSANAADIQSSELVDPSD